ncbi:MAG TPA: heme-binding domain-containing protein [Candidatus Sulfopaludibacter sp.]|nr:heme-binding domain-containing protein [Candidatus Sulfopaludibacter sp.]
MRKPSWRLALILCGFVVLASAISDIRPPGKAQAPLLAGARVPPEVRSAIERACLDCHSEATRYPWYSYVAPVSWLINRDVRSGRAHLNLSRWSEYSVIRRERCLSEIANQVQDGGMPLAIYVVMHRSARLSKTDIQAIFEWSQVERARLIRESSATRSQDRHPPELR